jgi:hypothetical protein
MGTFRVMMYDQQPIGTDRGTWGLWAFSGEFLK